MTNGLLNTLLYESASRRPDAPALEQSGTRWTYDELTEAVQGVASALVARGLRAHDRVAIYLPKQLETVAAIFGTAAAGGAFVPINPLLKPEQVGYILNDCAARVLITSADRATNLAQVLTSCANLNTVVITGRAIPDLPDSTRLRPLTWDGFVHDLSDARQPHRIIDSDIAAILYTSGSTGKPKGVVLSHRNMVAGARSVADYLGNTAEDRLLAVLPFSFDYGFSQLSTAFSVGASVSLLDYLLPNDVIKAVLRDHITGLAGVPPLWAQLAQLRWPREASVTLRYITNSGGKMPRATLGRLREALPKTRVFLMYGLTEAFRSTYLPPEELERRPDSIGKAIPNAEIMVVRDDGTPCEAGEPGELIHRGSLVAMGYWNDPEKTAHRFKPAPGRDPALVLPEVAVWSGDTVYKDSEGFLYFVGRRDDMIKTSGYRVSPTELEEVVYGSGLVTECAAIGVPDDRLGQAIVIVAAADNADDETAQAVIAACREHLANFMIPSQVVWRDQLPRNPNGKIDRKTLSGELGRAIPESSND